MGCSSSKKSLDDRASDIDHEKAKHARQKTRTSTRSSGVKKGSSGTKTPKYRTRIDSRVLAKYDIKALIGKGSFSDVLRVENKITKQPFAVKILRLKTTNARDLFESELAVLRRVRHQFIIQLVEVFESKDCIYLVMELATGGELYDRIKMKGYLSEKETVYVLRMVLEGVKYLHGIGVTHRDLKPENVLFYHPGQYSKILITDFGFAKSREANEDGHALFSTWCGTPEYIAPELIWKKPYTNAVDMWAIGVITYVMLSGHLPFAAESTVKLYQQIVRANYSYSREVWKNVSQASKNFIDTLLVVDPDSRNTAENGLKHPWLVAHGSLFSKHSGYMKSSSQNSGTGRSGKSGKSTKNSRNGRLRHRHQDETSLTPSRFSHDVENNGHSKKIGESGVMKTVAQRPTNVKIEGNKQKTEQDIEGKRLEAVESTETPTAISRFKLLRKEKMKENDQKYVSKSTTGAGQVQEEFPSAAATEGSDSVFLGNGFVGTDSNPFVSGIVPSCTANGKYEEIEMKYADIRRRFSNPTAMGKEQSSHGLMQFSEGQTINPQPLRNENQATQIMPQTEQESTRETLTQKPGTFAAGEVSLQPNSTHVISAKKLHAKSFGNLSSALISPRLFPGSRDTSFMEKVGQWLEEQRVLESGRGPPDVKSGKEASFAPERSDSFLSNGRIALGTARESHPMKEVAVIGDARIPPPSHNEDVAITSKVVGHFENSTPFSHSLANAPSYGARYSLSLSIDGIGDVGNPNKGNLNRHANGIVSRPPCTTRPFTLPHPLNIDLTGFKNESEPLDSLMSNKGTNGILFENKLERISFHGSRQDRQGRNQALEKGKEEKPAEERKELNSRNLNNALYVPENR